MLSWAGMASAAHEGRANLSTSGYLQFGVGFGENENFQEEGDDNFTADQRLRQYFDYVASENLSATVGYEFNNVWGSGDAHVGADADSQLQLKRAMVEFTWPETEATMTGGIQFIALPSVAMGSNPVLAGDMAGVTLSTPMGETADLTVGWSRGYDNTTNNASPGLDSFFAALPVNMDGMSMAPFAMYTVIGQNTNATALTTAPTDYRSGFVTPNGQLSLGNDNANAYWLGSNFEMTMMDPIGVKASFIYGSLNTDQEVNERAGWYADLSVDYEMEAMTPEFFAFYSSGEDDDAADGSEVMPYVFNDGLTSQGPSMMIGDMTSLGITSTGANLLQSNPVGLWSAGLSLKHIQLMDKLSATLTGAYYQGTSDDAVNNPAIALTEEDSAWDITASSSYQLYEDLSAIVEAGYAKKDMDNNIDDEPATRFAAGFNYSF
ncbi:MAG: outer membrane homotrimeric porin [Desulfohalobiaceae bacterium]|nr:outer membrane homotrimeric porin [Desulfohalobiaceae bacterium]